MVHDLVTASEISRAVCASGERVRHVLRTRPIEPVAHAGLVRLYEPAAIERVRAELAEQDRRRCVSA